MAPVSARTLPTLAALYRSGAWAAPRVEEGASAGLASLSSSAPPLSDRIVVWRGSITDLAVDAIVNAANRSLLGGGGVDGAIHRAAGPALRRACAALHGCATGDAKITDAFRLPCRKIVHTVGPVYDEQPSPDDARRLLAACYRRSLEAAAAAGCRSIAFCAISTGVYGYPPAAAARVAATTVRDYLLGPAGADMDRVVFVAFDDKDAAAYEAVLPEVFPPEEGAEAATETEAAPGGASETAETTDTADASAPKPE